MFCPFLSTWIEQRTHFICLRIKTLDFVTFVPVTKGASKPKIGLVVVTAFCYGDNMIDLKLCVDIMLRDLDNNRSDFLRLPEHDGRCQQRYEHEAFSA